MCGNSRTDFDSMAVTRSKSAYMPATVHFSWIELCLNQYQSLARISEYNCGITTILKLYSLRHQLHCKFSEFHLMSRSDEQETSNWFDRVPGQPVVFL